MALFFGILFGIPSPCAAQQGGPTEYQLKAAFLYNFVKFVDWPPQAFASPSSDYVIGVFGDNPFGDDLMDMIKNKTVKSRQLHFQAFQSIGEAENCQVLFISASEKNHFAKILAVLGGKPVLTVSDTPGDGFIRAGGMINFVFDQDHHIRFQINNAAAKKAGLTISSDLLSLAVP